MAERKGLYAAEVELQPAVNDKDAEERYPAGKTNLMASYAP